MCRHLSSVAGMNIEDERKAFQFHHRTMALSFTFCRSQVPAGNCIVSSTASPPTEQCAARTTMTTTIRTLSFTPASARPLKRSKLYRESCSLTLSQFPSMRFVRAAIGSSLIPAHSSRAKRTLAVILRAATTRSAVR